MVLLPVALTAGYLYTRAVDQYTSTVGFAVRTQETGQPVDLLGGLTSSLAGLSSSSDTDILYEFIRSQALAVRVDAALDLRGHYSAAYGADPIFAFDPEGSTEDLVDYWRRVVKVFYDTGTGLIELRVHAFDPETARAVAQEILDESTEVINRLSAIARDDATRYAREELERTMERLREARQEMTAFRSRTRIVDPTADLQSQMGVLGTLQQQLAGALVELDLLRDTARADDPRVTQAERRIEVIRDRIDQERQKFTIGSEEGTGEDYATIMAEFERLMVDREFAERAYTNALAAYDLALAEARRKSRYLAAYVDPTLAEEALYPERGILTALVAFFALLIWAVAVLVWYAIRDRR
jgi:capsular polysaccharide transport system permease protein